MLDGKSIAEGEILLRGAAGDQVKLQGKKKMTLVLARNLKHILSLLVHLQGTQTPLQEVLKGLRRLAQSALHARIGPFYKRGTFRPKCNDSTSKMTYRTVGIPPCE